MKKAVKTTKKSANAGQASNGAPADAVTAAKAAAARASAANPRSVAELMARAYAMEAEAVERYSEFADQMEVHNNRDVAALFRKLATIEAKHREHFSAGIAGSNAPRSDDFRWEGPEGPETGDINDLHYLMQPYHALKIALHNEQRAVEYFEKLASTARLPAEVRDAAAEMAEEEREHVRLIEEWLRKVPEPAEDWDTDLDPPVVTE